MRVFEVLSPGEIHVAAFESPSLRQFRIGAEQAVGILASPIVREDALPRTRKPRCVAPHKRPRFVSRYGGRRFGAHRLEAVIGLQGCTVGL
jgi:hypothetical protein